MTSVECDREQSVVTAVLDRQWPHGCDEELRMHAETCEICREVVTVASVLREDHLRVRGEVQVPAAGQVWWRAAVRARLEAVETASRPITWLQGVAGAAVAGFAVALFGYTWPTAVTAVAWLADRAPTLDPATIEMARLLAATLQTGLPFALALAALLVLTPIVLYFALADD